MVNSVFVLGAGASNEFNFPLNEGLKDEIVYKLRTPSIGDKNKEITELMDIGFSRGQIFNFCRHLQGDFGVTIDEFLSENKGFWTLGKHAIAQALISREDPNSIREKPSNQNWCKVLIKQICDSLEKFNEKDLSFITFNYDRSLEFALFDALASRYNTITPDEIIKAFQKVKIIHVHGMLANLEYELLGNKFIVTKWRGSSRPYTHKREDARPITLAAEGINIVHEEIDDTQEFKDARKLLSEASNVAFIGFGFDKKNFERLSRGGTLKNKNYIRYNLLQIDPNKSKQIERATDGIITGGHAITGNTLQFLNTIITQGVIFS